MRLLKKIFNSEFIIFIRNIINFKPSETNINFIKSNASVSDAFCWRTDKNFHTIIKFSNLIKFFYDLDASIYIIFYSKKNKKIKELIIENTNTSHELKIDKEFMNGIEDYGNFYIFHQISKLKTVKNILVNRCYVGYAIKNNHPSFVHGNILSKYILSQNNKEKDIIQKTFFYKNYNVQKNYKSNNLEYYISNPTSKKIKIFVENKKMIFEPFESRILKSNNQILSLKSDCMLLRPIIFEYKDKFLNVHHG